MSVFSDNTEVDNLAPEPPKNKSANVGWIVALGIAVIAIVFVTLRSRDVERQRLGTDHPGVGQVLSDVSLEPLTGGEPVRIDDLHGKVVLMNYWGPWCMYCKVEFPDLISLVKKNKANSDFVFLSVSCPYDDGSPVPRHKGETAEYLNSVQAGFEAHFDPNMTSRRSIVASARMDGFNYPTTVLIDRKGTIRGIWNGFSPGDAADMDHMVTQVLNDK